jgi:hypothetical protein
VTALYAGGIGPQLYAIRFLGEVNAMPFTGAEIEPAPLFQPVRTKHGIARSLSEAEDLLISTAARIRMDELGKATPNRADIKDRHLLATALGEVCGLTAEAMLRQVQMQVTARVEEGLATQAASALGREHAYAGMAPYEPEAEAVRRLIGLLQRRGLTIPPDPAFQRIMLVEYRNAFDRASEPSRRNGPYGVASRVAAPQLADRDFPRHPGKTLPIAPENADPVASSPPARRAGPDASSRATSAP